MHPTDPALNDYVDQALDAPARADVERHLEACRACRNLVDDLREIRRAAGTLTPIDPPDAVWRRIQAAIRSDASTPEAAAPARGRQLGWLAIAATVLLAAVLGLWMGPFGPGSGTPEPAGDVTTVASAETVESELRQAEQHYDNAIKGLQQIANEGEGELDPAMAATLQKNLAVIDQAIDESRAAVRSEPTSEPARESLLENFATKIALLQDTVALINEMRKGNDAGAAEIVSGLK
jgi:hypothetical protein